MKVNESNNDDAVDNEEEAKVDKRAVGLFNFIPAFMIYGPYAVARYCYSLRYISTYMHVHERTHVLRTHMMLRKI